MDTTVRSLPTTALPDEAIDVPTAATLADVSQKTIRKHIHSGALPGVRYRGQLWVSRQDVRDFFSPRPVAGAATDPEHFDHVVALLGGGAR